MMRRIVLAAALILSACGGTTGYLVTVSVPADLVPGTDFDKIFVQVTTPEKGAQSNTFSVSVATPKPYRVIVWNNDDKSTELKIQAQLQKAGQPVKDKIVPGLRFTSGELTEFTITVE